MILDCAITTSENFWIQLKTKEAKFYPIKTCDVLASVSQRICLELSAQWIKLKENKIIVYKLTSYPIKYKLKIKY